MRRWQYKTIPAAAAVFIFWWAGLAVAATVSVVLPEENTVSGRRILLGDIAFIEPLVPEGQALAEALKTIDLGPAPEPGRELALSQGQLEQRLLASRLNVSEAIFQAPREIRLTSAGQAVTEDSLKKIVLEYLAGHEPYRSGRFELLSLSSVGRVDLPPGAVSYRFVPQSSSNPTYLTGYVYFSVDGSEVSRVRLTGQVDLSIPALVAARALPRGRVIAEDDLALSLTPYAEGRGALVDPDQAIGSTVKTSLTVGEAVKDRHLTKSLLVRRGDMVTIIAQSGPLRVTATGQSRQDGALGDTITVINLDSKKAVSARVIGPSQVEILF